MAIATSMVQSRRARGSRRSAGGRSPPAAAASASGGVGAGHVGQGSRPPRDRPRPRPCRARLAVVPMRRRLALLSALIALVSAASACGAAPASELPPRPTVDRFDEGRAFAEVRRQVAIGPRPAGSAASRRLAARLRRALPGGRFEAVPGGLRNVVGRLPARGSGAREKAVVVAAHYDTKDLPGFVGANDGASGTATVVELARALARRPAPAQPARDPLRAVRRRGEPAGRDGLPDGRPAGQPRLPGGAPPRDRAGDRGRLRRRPGPVAAARGRLGPRAVAGAAPGRRPRRRRQPSSRPFAGARSSTTTRPSPARGSRRST